MEPNDYQIGGDHYKGEYQHWDFVCDCELPYLIGCATKYVYRWRNKDGTKDLRKALHYINKAQERHVKFAMNDDMLMAITRLYPGSTDLPECEIIAGICDSQYTVVMRAIESLIFESEFPPNPELQS